MKKLLNSYITFTIALILLFIMSYALVGFYSSAFGYYSFVLFNTAYGSLYAIGLTLFLPAAILFFSSAWVLISNNKLNFIRKLNFTFINIFIPIMLLILFFYTQTYLASLLLNMIILPSLFYLLVAFWSCKILSFLEETGKYKEIFWVKFYSHFPIHKPIGFSMSICVLISLLTFRYETLISIILLVLLNVLVYHLSMYSRLKEENFEKLMDEKMKSEHLKTELIANVSHDIKTPITSIINYSDIIKNKDISDEQRDEYLNVIHNKSQRLTKLIDDLIEATKAGTGNLTVNPEKINICEILGQIAGEYDDQIQLNNLELFTSIPEKDIYISADGRLLWRVFENLFSNVVKYSMEGTRVYLALQEQENSCTFSLKNISSNPLNISPDELTEQFIRGDKSRASDGSGLGLSITKSLCEAMGIPFDISISGDLF